MEQKIKYIEPIGAKELEATLHPLVKEWFFSRFEKFSATQLHAVKYIHDRKNILVSAPTGGTKTLTAFLAIINYLVELASKNELEDKVYCVYVSPLKALSNDISVNLKQPLREIEELAGKKGVKLQEMRVGLRTGDTSVAERAKMAKKIPHILVTTPESLAIILTSPVFSKKLGAVEFVIVDEIHAIANKRGVFLSLILEKLGDMSLIEPVRVGLSATIAPLEEIAGFLVGAHHSSMSKRNRFEIEDRLRKGELKVVVTSTSLELGIDIGNIDLVVLLRSPKGVARALQRIGRAGHKLHENPKGRFIVLDRDDLIECSVMMKQMRERVIDRVHVPQNALDVLAQHIFGMAITRIWKVDEMLKNVRKSYCYRNLSKEDFFGVVSYLAGDYALEERNVYAKIWYDQKSGEIGKRGKLARVIYMTNIGTIPEEGFIEVVIASPAERKGQSVGSIDEGFVERLKKGDVFVLGGVKYLFMHSRGMKAFVRADVSRNPTVPSWFSEMLPLSYDVAVEIGRLRGLIKERIRKPIECMQFIEDYLGCSKKVSEEIYFYMKEQSDFSELPSDKEIVIERFKSDKEFLLFHTMYGRRINDALSRAYGYSAGLVKGRDVEIGINDNGFFITGEDLNVDKILKNVNEKEFDRLLKEAIDKTDVLKRRFRHCASRSLMILRNYKGRTKSVGKQQVHSGFLLSAVRDLGEGFPILREAKREVLEDVMDILNAREIVKKIDKWELKVKIVDTPLVSPFGLNLMVQSHSDLIKMEERAAFLKRMHELHLGIIRDKTKLA